MRHVSRRIWDVVASIAGRTPSQGHPWPGERGDGPWKLDHVDRVKGEGTWKPPEVRPGDLILNGTITYRDGNEEVIRVLVRPEPDGQRQAIFGFDGPIDLPSGASFSIEIPMGRSR